MILRTESQRLETGHGNVGYYVEPAGILSRDRTADGGFCRLDPTLRLEGPKFLDIRKNI
jgi:hypothetical protein